MSVSIQFFDSEAPKLPLNLDPTANSALTDARSGTELMRHRLFTGLDGSLLNEVQVIVPARLEGVELTARPKILWIHDLPSDPALDCLKDKTYADQFFIVCVSHWQHQQLLTAFPHLNPEKVITIPNGIEPITWSHEQKYKSFEEDGNRVQLIYTPTPHRGLPLLVAAVTSLAEKRDDFTLHVCSSFKIYGQTWAEKDAEFAQLYDICKNHPRIQYHGTLPNNEVRDLLVKSHIFAYPSIYPETSCLAAIEAGAAGCKLLTSPLAALPETCGHFANYLPLGVPPVDLASHTMVMLDIIIGHVKNALETKNEGWNMGIGIQAAYYNNFYNWHHSLAVWHQFVRSILENSK